MKKLYVWVDANDPFIFRINTEQGEKELKSFIDWAKIVDERAKNVFEIDGIYFIHKAIKAFRVTEIKEENNE